MFMMISRSTYSLNQLINETDFNDHCIYNVYYIENEAYFSNVSVYVQFIIETLFFILCVCYAIALFYITFKDLKSSR